MVRERAVVVWLLVLGCGSRTDLLFDSDPDSSMAGHSAGGELPLSGRGGGGAGGRPGKGGAAAGGVGTGAASGKSTGGFGVGGRLGAGGGGSGGTSGLGGASGGGGGASAGQAGSAGTGGAPLRLGCKPGVDVPAIELDRAATLDANDFVQGSAIAYRWTLQAEDCDAVVSDSELTLEGANTSRVKFQPSRPSTYHFRLEARGRLGDEVSCELAVPIKAVGMRVELCWDTSTTTDLDLYLHTPFDQATWFSPQSGSVVSGLDATTCNTSNCSAILRGLDRVDWGYPDSPLAGCSAPGFEGFAGVGRCPNPRAADDNNQQIASGTTERVQLDNPKDGQTFRVAAQNFNNLPAHPRVFVYCGGVRAGAFEPPPEPADFVIGFFSTYGVVWRAADITALVDGAGNLSCSAVPVQGTAVTTEGYQY